MMVEVRKFLGAVCCMFLIVQNIQAQTSLFYNDVEKAYRDGLELFDEGNYASARKVFEQVNTGYYQHKPIKNEVTKQNLDFYIAYCAIENNDADAEQLLKNYTHDYHETDKQRMINYLLGKFYYNNKKYSEAITYLEKVKEEDLTPAQKTEYNFDLGYSYFTKKKFAEAKPYFKKLINTKDKYYYPANYYYAFISFYTNDYKEALRSFKAIEDSKMYAAVIPYYVAQIYYAQKEYDQVLAYVPMKVDDAGVQYKSEMNYLLGQAYFQKGSYIKALPLLDAYLSKQPKARKDELYMLGYCQYKTGDYARAIKNFEQLNLLDEAIGQYATFTLAECYLKTSQLEKARSAYQSAASKSFDEKIALESQFQYSKLSVELGYYNEAVSALENLSPSLSSEKKAEANELLASALFKTRNYDKAYKIIENTGINTPKLKEVYQQLTYFRSIELFNDGKYEESIDLATKSTQYPISNAVLAQALFLLGDANYNTDRFDDAINYFNRYAQLNEPETENASPFMASYNTGYAYFKKKNYRNAATYFERAIDKSAESKNEAQKTKVLPDAWLRYADCAFVTKDYTGSLKAYNEIVNRRWSSAEYALYQKAIVLGLSNKNNEKIVALESLINTYTKSTYLDKAWFEIGETHLETENYDAALRAYNKVVTSYTKSNLVPRSYLQIALVQYNQNQKELSFASYKKVIQDFPNTPVASEAMRALKETAVELGKTDEYVNVAGKYGSISTSEQDTLTFQAAETAFSNGNCEKAVPLLSNYITKFGNGVFVNEAHYMRAECYTKQKQFADAYGDYNTLIKSRYSKYYEQSLLRASGIAYFEVKNYQEAYDLYRQLLDNSSSQPNTYTAQLGLLKTSYRLNKHEDVLRYADVVLANTTLKENDVLEINYMKAKATYSLNDVDKAYPLLTKVAQGAVSEKAAECKYLSCKILYDKQQYKASLDSCIKLKNRFASYEYWVVKTFIMMADNYYALGNAFQAKATLESLIAGYKGDQALVAEAKQKLEAMQQAELNKSRLVIPESGDTLIMEQNPGLK